MLDQGLQETKRKSRIPQDVGDIHVPEWSFGKCRKLCSNEKTDLADGLCINCWDKTVDYNYQRARDRSRPNERARKQHARKNSSI